MPRADLAEDGLVGGDREVADGGEHVAAADGIARHPADHGLGHVADQRLQLLDRHAVGAAAVVVAVVHRLVAAGAEGAVAGAGQHDDADVSVPAGLEEGLDQLLDGVRAEGVHHLGAVDGDGGDALLLACRGCRCRWCSCPFPALGCRTRAAYSSALRARAAIGNLMRVSMGVRPSGSDTQAPTQSIGLRYGI